MTNESYLRRYLADVEPINPNTEVQGVQVTLKPNELIEYLRRYLADSLNS